MTSFYKTYGNCTGPFGFPMKETDARELDAFLSEHTKDSALEYKHKSNLNAFEYFIAGERADVSKVTDSSIDKSNEIVKAEGLNWDIFKKNPVVTLNHNYYLPPIGKSVWQKQVGECWKAKTIYPEKPSDYPQEKEWPADTIWHMVKSSFLSGKSIGFIPTKWHEPTREEISKNFALKDADLIFDEAKVYEYAVCSIGCNDNAVVENVAKSLKNIPEELLDFFPDFRKLFETNNPPPPTEEKIVVPKNFKVITVAQTKEQIKAVILDGVKSSMNINDVLDTLRGKV